MLRGKQKKTQYTRKQNSPHFQWLEQKARIDNFFVRKADLGGIQGWGGGRLDACFPPPPPQ